DLYRRLRRAGAGRQQAGLSRHGRAGLAAVPGVRRDPPGGMLGRRPARRQGHRLQGRGEGGAGRKRGLLLGGLPVQGGARRGQQTDARRPPHESVCRHALRRQAHDLRRLHPPARHRRRL
ncbi:MAG: Protein of unknown function DUF1428, partial [uncultured Microvirga sp.]